MEIANVLLVSKAGQIVMQHRDDKPTISNPGRISAFGGSMEPGETPVEAAVRELKEELGIDVPPKALIPFRTYQKTQAVHGEDATVYVFVLENVEPEGLTLYEGQAIRIVDPQENLSAINFTILARQFVQEYLDEHHA